MTQKQKWERSCSEEERFRPRQLGPTAEAEAGPWKEQNADDGNELEGDRIRDQVAEPDDQPRRKWEVKAEYR